MPVIHAVKKNHLETNLVSPSRLGTCDSITCTVKTKLQFKTTVSSHKTHM